MRAIDRQSASGQARIASADILIRRGIAAPAQAYGERVMILDF